MKYPDKSCLILDHGAYVQVAQMMAKEFGKVYYYTPWEQSFPTSNDTLIGSGFKEFERVNHYFDYIDKCDLFVFTDIYHGDLQDYLVKQGKRVWGAREGDSLEIYKWDFLQHLTKLDLPIAPTELIIGIDELRKHLKKVDDKYIKVDAMTRGDIETFHHINYDISESVIDKLEYAVGVNRNSVRFLVQDPIPSKSEIGYDGYTVDGQFPDECLFGIEVKDQGYVGEVRKYSDIPKEIKFINDKFSNTLKAYGYRGMWSTEIRLGQDGKIYFIDPTCRFPSPPTSVMVEIYSNLPEIIYEGAGGKMIQPEFSGKIGAEVIGTSEFVNKGVFYQLFYPDSEKEFIKQMHPCIVDGKMYSIPQHLDDSRIAEVVAIGNNFEDTIKQLEARCGKIKGHKLNLDCSVLASAVEELKKL